MFEQYLAAIKVVGVAAVVALLMGGGGYAGWNGAANVYDKRIDKITQELNDQKLHELQNKIDAIDALNKALEVEQEKGTKLAGQLAAALSKNKKLKEASDKNVIKEIEKPVYRECVVPDSGVSVLNTTIRGFNQQREADNTSNPADPLR